MSIGLFIHGLRPSLALLFGRERRGVHSKVSGIKIFLQILMNALKRPASLEP
jgi:hypothetical protein